jgi:3-oxoacyl-[acyl-carrier protein] reductase
MKSHANKVVLVTGAGSGIGKGIAEAFAQHGAAVGLLDFNGENAERIATTLRDQGLTAHAYQADVVDFNAVSSVCADIERTLGPIDIIINNAGISPKRKGIPVETWKMDVEEWRRVIDVNLSGAFNTVRVVVPGMVKRRSGSIVNMSSVAGRAHLWMVAVHYSTTKAGLIGFTRHLAGELGPYGITVNALAPGRIDTPLMHMVPEEINQKALEQTPLGRYGLPEDVASAALFLTSAEAGFITGQVLDVAGGWFMT